MGEAPRCGTRAGYLAHLAAGEKTCAECRAEMKRLREALPAASKARHIGRVAATQSALARLRTRDLELYRQLLAEERARLVTDYRKRRQPLPHRSALTKNARYRALRRMSSTFPDDYRTYRSEELALRGVE